MRIKELFTVPEGKKVTEKMFAKVLISSVCSILLCMACLAGTTWAWFAVSIENTGNVIQIATVTADVSISDGINSALTESSDNCYALDAGTYTVETGVNNDATDWKQPVYVLMSVIDGEEVDYYYFTFAPNNHGSQIIQFTCGNQVTVSFSALWIEPASAEPVGHEALITDEIPTEPETEPSTQSTSEATEESTEGGTETTAPTAAATEPSDETSAPTEAATEPSAGETTIPTTEATEPATEPATVPPTTGETTAPPETTPVTEESTIPTAAETTAPATEPTVASTEVTEPSVGTEATTVPPTTE